MICIIIIPVSVCPLGVIYRTLELDATRFGHLYLVSHSVLTLYIRHLNHERQKEGPVGFANRIGGYGHKHWYDM